MHYYEPAELRQCLLDTNLKNFNLDTDSLGLVFFGFMTQMVGSPQCGCNSTNWYSQGEPAKGCSLGNETSCVAPFELRAHQNYDVVFFNHQMMHLMWHKTLEQFKKSPVGTHLNAPFKIWLDSPALMSEREAHDTLPRAQLFNAAAWERLSKQGGWISLDYFEMTLPFATNRDASFDSMHYYSWLGRVMLHKFMNILCNGWKQTQEKAGKH
jgi:hypothetical protein